MTLLAQLSDRIQKQPIKDRITAQFVRIAAGYIRDTNTTPERRTWAMQVLQAPSSMVTALALNIFYTNPTVSSAMDINASGETIPDGDIEYVVLSEILPLILPA